MDPNLRSTAHSAHALLADRAYTLDAMVLRCTRLTPGPLPTKARSRSGLLLGRELLAGFVRELNRASDVLLLFGFGAGVCLLLALYEFVLLGGGERARTLSKHLRRPTSASPAAPTFNIDGTPMCGGVDARGNPYGVTSPTTSAWND